MDDDEWEDYNLVGQNEDDTETEDDLDDINTESDSKDILPSVNNSLEATDRSLSEVKNEGLTRKRSQADAELSSGDMKDESLVKKLKHADLDNASYERCIDEDLKESSEKKAKPHGGNKELQKEIVENDSKKLNKEGDVKVDIKTCSENKANVDSGKHEIQTNGTEKKDIKELNTQEVTFKANINCVDSPKESSVNVKNVDVVKNIQREVTDKNDSEDLDTGERKITKVSESEDSDGDSGDDCGNIVEGSDPNTNLYTDATKPKNRRGLFSKKRVAKLLEKIDVTVKGREKKKRYCKLRYHRERLIAELELKFAACDELETECGTIIDKELIMESVHNRLKESFLRKIWNAVHGHTYFTPDALKHLEYVHSKYLDEEFYESVFDITYMNTKEKMFEEFQQRRNYPCYIRTQHKCTVCFLGFQTKKLLQVHQNCHDVTAGTFICTVCGLRVTRGVFLGKHMQQCHDAVYKCRFCTLVTYDRNYMMDHCADHQGVGKYGGTGGEPGEEAEGEIHYENVNLPKIKPSARVRCPLCNAFGESDTWLNMHYNLAHPSAPRQYMHPQGTQQHKCKVCDQTFWRVHQLHAHEETHFFTRAYAAADERPFACGQCNKRFSNKRSLHQHYQWHGRLKNPASRAATNNVFFQQNNPPGKKKNKKKKGGNGLAGQQQGVKQILG